MTVHGTQRAIAIVLARTQDAKRVNVRQMREGGLFLLHLAPDGIGPLFPPMHLDIDACLDGETLDFGADGGDHVAGVAAQLDETAHDRGAGLGMQHLEGQILELLADRLHAHAPGQRGIDLHGLPRDPLALVRAQMRDCAHVVQPVSQLDQDHADILGHGQQQLAEILGLGGGLRAQLQLRQLGDPVDQIGDLGTEKPRDLLIGGRRVLDGVVQQRGDDRGIIDPQFGQDRGDFQRMPEIRVTIGALLVAMRLRAEHIGAVQQQLIGFRIVFADPVDQFVLTDHPVAPLSRPSAVDQRPCSAMRARISFSSSRSSMAGWGEDSAPPAISMAMLSSSGSSTSMWR